VSLVVPRTRVSSGAIEALKWLALLCMVVDHVNAALYGRELGVLADVVGRIALPLFACVFGFNLARPGADAGRALWRLLLAGAIALPAHAALFGVWGLWPLNILFTFALAAWVVIVLRAGHARLALASFVLGGALVEYWWPGVALVLATYAAARSPRLTVADAVAVGLALVGLCVLVNGNAYALLAVPLALVVVHLAPHVPRLRGWFLWFYPAHLWVLALVGLAW
jgi:hypothetical protein